MQQREGVVARHPLTRQHAPGHAGGEMAVRRQHHEIVIQSRRQCHLGQDADAQSGPHVGLDQVGIACGEGDARLQPGLGEGLAQ